MNEDDQANLQERYDRLDRRMREIYSMVQEIFSKVNG